MKSKDQQLLEEAYNKVLNEGQPDDPRQNVADYSNRRTADYSEPKDSSSRRDPESPDYTKPTGTYAIEGPNPEKPGGLGYWDPVSGEFLYGKHDAPSSGIHKTSNLEAARTMAKKLSEENKDLSETFVSKNFAWAKPGYNPFKVVQFLRR